MPVLSMVFKNRTMKKLMLLMVVLALTAFKGGPTKNLVVVENPTTIRSVSFEAIHNLNVPMERADGRIVFPLTHTNALRMDILKDNYQQ
jgi:hypothetical protein